MKVFGDFYKLLSYDVKASQGLKHAIIEDGKIIATNGHALSYVDLGAWLSVSGHSTEKIEEMLLFAEGKALDYELLTKMARQWGVLEFTENHICLYKKAGGKPEAIRYSAVLVDKDSRKYQPIDYAGEAEGGTFTFANWVTIIPNTSGSCASVGIDAALLADLSSCFTGKDTSVLLEFMSSESRCSKIISVQSGYPSDLYKERGLIVPQVLQV